MELLLNENKEKRGGGEEEFGVRLSFPFGEKLGLFDDEVEQLKKQVVVKKLNNILEKWALKISFVKKIEKVRGSGNVKIIPFGSYRVLGNSAGADIDLLCLVSNLLTRLDIFELLPEFLTSREDITDFLAIPEAYVPVMKFKFDGVQVDLVFAVLPLPSIPPTINLTKDDLDLCLDEKSLLSLNGHRVTEKLLSIVPNVETFCMTLHFIKYWAKRRGIYSNQFGFMGGASWMLLVAYICKGHPDKTLEHLVVAFFQTFAEWKWPSPVFLCTSSTCWHAGENMEQLMPIITPSNPPMNSSFNVSYSTRKILMEELCRGKSIVEKIESGVARWTSLFEKEDFFLRYKGYFQFDVVAETEEILYKWEGFVKSKIRSLALALERKVPTDCFHPYPNFLDKSKSPPNSKSIFIGMTAKNPSDPSLVLVVLEFVNFLYTWPHRTPAMTIKAFSLYRNCAAVTLDPLDMMYWETKAISKPFKRYNNNYRYNYNRHSDYNSYNNNDHYNNDYNNYNYNNDHYNDNNNKYHDNHNNYNYNHNNYNHNYNHNHHYQNYNKEHRCNNSNKHHHGYEMSTSQPKIVLVYRPKMQSAA